MEAFYKDNHNTIYCLDFRKNELPDECVQMVCTSPPYWGLRKYSGEQELIWGDNHCEHQWGDTIPNPMAKSGKHGPASTIGAKDAQHAVRKESNQGSFCSRCGAWKGAYGLEPTPEMYIEHTIEILREIRRVLRKDGVVFWNIGDSYATVSGGMNQLAKMGVDDTPQYGDIKYKFEGVRQTMKGNGLKHKDLCLIPFRVAIAAQEDGWWVRSVIIWSKPNPMPESVTDRPTESHEYLLMLTQSGKSLYWTHRDGGGTREKPKADYRWVRYGVPDEKAIQKEIGGMARRGVWEERDGEGRGWRDAADRKHSDIIEEVAIEPTDWKKKIACPECEATGIVSVYLGLDVWQDKKCDTCHGKKEIQMWKRINLWQGHDYYWDADAVREPHHYPPHSPGNRSGFESKVNGHRGEWGEFKEPDRIWAAEGGRNIRSVWEFPTQPFPTWKVNGKEIDHFAVFPEKLPELCIKATTPEVGCCSKCGAPWERVKEPDIGGTKGHSWHPHIDDLGQGNVKHQTGKEYATYKRGETLGWQPTCKCNADKVPSIVLDPMMGAGTTLWVAKKLNRRAVGYEISEEYCQLAVDRCRQQVLL